MPDHRGVQFWGASYGLYAFVVSHNPKTGWHCSYKSLLSPKATLFGPFRTEGQARHVIEDKAQQLIMVPR